jgi:hypothetical protein
LNAPGALCDVDVQELVRPGRATACFVASTSCGAG